METLKKSINADCDYRMRDETMDAFLGLMTEIHLKNNEPLIPYGKVDNNAYMIKDGVIRLAYFDGLTEKTFAFATAGTLLLSYHSFQKGMPSSFQYESCGESVVMKVPRVKFDELLKQSDDFKNWFLKISLEQLWHWEMKMTVISGSSEERFESLMTNRPEIIERVPLKTIASYIGISPQWLSTIKNRHMPKSDFNVF